MTAQEEASKGDAVISVIDAKTLGLKIPNGITTDYGNNGSGSASARKARKQQQDLVYKFDRWYVRSLLTNQTYTLP
jgi:hypothetical protein